MARTETATFGGGCFWCLEPVFGRLRGVLEVTPGYAGGDFSGPSYEQVCSGETGHAEVCQILFDPDQIAYRDLLEVFFAVHDPTTLDRQGADVGGQYRSIILYHSDDQRASAEDLIDKLPLAADWEGTAIVTEVEPCRAFFPAEPYHQKYFANNPNQPYCRLVIGPKLAKFEKTFAPRLDRSR